MKQLKALFDLFMFLDERISVDLTKKVEYLGSVWFHATHRILLYKSVQTNFLLAILFPTSELPVAQIFGESKRAPTETYAYKCGYLV